MNRKFVYWVLPFLLIILLLSGCGPKKTPKQPSTPTLKTIKIINETGENSVYTEGTLQFSAEGYDQNGRKMEGITFEWSVDPAKFGEITQDGKFTAGKEAGECQVVCAANGVVQKVTVTIKGKLEPSKPTKIVIKPDKPKVLVGSQVQFEATVMDQYDQAMSNVEFEWILAEGEGEITADGLFTAGNNPGIYELICKAGDISSDPVQIEVTTIEEHLQKAGEQLVSDSQTAWNSFTQSDRLPIILNQELMPHAELIFSVVDDVTEHVMWYDLFCLPAREYPAYTEEEIWDLILELELEDYTPGEGTWRYKKEVFDENDEYLGMWTVVVTRLESEENEEYEFDLTYEEHMGVTNTYSGTINQPLIDDDEINEGDLISRDNLFDIEFWFGNEINGQMRISAEGTEQVIKEECTEYEYDYDTEESIETTYYYHDVLLLNLNGEVEGYISYKTGEKYEFNGTLDLGFGQDETDTFVGTINTPSADLEGEVTITYVDNESFPEAVPTGGIVLSKIPNKLTFSGSLDDRESDLLLDGDFMLELTRADIFNFNEGYTSSNWLGLKLDFEGTMQVENNQVAGNLRLEESNYKQIEFEVNYVLTLDGVTRQINLNARSSDDGKKVEIGIDSSWGQARIDLELTFDPEFIVTEEDEFGVGELVDVSGTLLVQGVEVGEIKIEEGVPWVIYNDDSKETL